LTSGSALGAALVALLIAALATNRGGRPSVHREAEGARWARRRDLAALTVKGPSPGRLVLGTAGRRLVAAERGQSVLVVGPTQSAKTTGLAIPAILEWEGPVMAASVKADLARHTMNWRRTQGEVWLFDPTRSTGLATSAWSPLDAAITWPAARRVAHSLTEAARPAAGSMPDADFWFATAAKLLGPLLLAAASSGRCMADVVRWLDEQEEAEVAEALFELGADAALQAARATWGRDERQRSAVYTTAETVVEAFAEPPASGGAASGAGEGNHHRVDPAVLLEGRHTLYLCAPAHEQRRLRPLFSALATEVLQGAFDLAVRHGGTLDPPLLVVLDEAANVAPLAELDVLASTAAGHGIQLVTVWQDLAQITARYGGRAGSVINNHRVKVFLSGIADTATLEHASTLAGESHRPQRTVTSDGRGGRSVTEAPVSRRLLPPDAVRRLPPGTGVVISGHLPPLRLALRPWWRDVALRRRAQMGAVASPSVS